MYIRDRIIKSIENSACLTRRQIDDYLNNKLFPEELYVVEMHLVECPFCNDAIEGYTKAPEARVTLGKADNFAFPDKSAALAADKVKTVSSAKAVANPGSAPKEQPNRKVPVSNSFGEEPRRSKSPWVWAIVGLAALGLGGWMYQKGFLGGRNDVRDNVTDASLNGNVDSSALMLNSESIDRVADSIINAKFGFQNQAPLAPVAKKVEYIVPGGTRKVVDNSEHISSERQQTSSHGGQTVAEKSSGFIGPTLPPEENAKKSSTTEHKSTTTISTQRSSAASSPAAAPAAGTKEQATQNTKQESAKNTEQAKTEAADRKNTAAAKSNEIAQAEKDFAKGLELYNKQQYAASIMYFQAAAKVKDFSRRKQAESYVKLAKSEVVNAERKKNAER
ncbi:MAG TPA: hypothetical protein VKZ76_02725 [Edaphocola sp.]|nr:hypothetical protein [Edaphocola sp.]